MKMCLVVAISEPSSILSASVSSSPASSGLSEGIALLRRMQSACVFV